MTGAPVVHIIDDDPAARDSLAFLMESAGLAARVFASAEDFLACLGEIEAGCIVSDIRMPGLSGIDLIAELRRRGHAGHAIILITGHGDVPLAVEAMKRGAADFFEKPYDDGKLIAAVRAALDAGSARHAADEEREAILRRYASLSGRERDVLRGLVSGAANKVIANDLGISPRTVEIYRANVMAKMEADSLSSLVRMAISHGLERQ
ncbi:MAG: response regulator FixJ [Hyphomonadaceae bacterium]